MSATPASDEYPASPGPSTSPRRHRQRTIEPFWEPWPRHWSTSREPGGTCTRFTDCPARPSSSWTMRLTRCAPQAATGSRRPARRRACRTRRRSRAVDLPDSRGPRRQPLEDLPRFSARHVISWSSLWPPPRGGHKEDRRSAGGLTHRPHQGPEVGLIFGGTRSRRSSSSPLRG